MAMVIPSWKGMQESSQQMKTVLEPTIKDKKDELAAVQRKVMWDLSGKQWYRLLFYKRPFWVILEGYAVNYTSAVTTIATGFPCPFEEDRKKTIQIFVEATRTTSKG